MLPIGTANWLQIVSRLLGSKLWKTSKLPFLQRDMASVVASFKKHSWGNTMISLPAQHFKQVKDFTWKEQSLYNIWSVTQEWVSIKFLFFLMMILQWWNCTTTLSFRPYRKWEDSSTSSLPSSLSSAGTLTPFRNKSSLTNTLAVRQQAPITSLVISNSSCTNYLSN